MGFMDFNNNSEEYIDEDYNLNDYSSQNDTKENKFIKGIIDNSLDKKDFKFSKSVDVRLILTNLEYIESISSTINNFDLSNFNVVISSIIPTNNLEIAKSTTQGADLLLVATEFSDEGKKLFYQFKKYLKTNYNYIEYLKLPEKSSKNSDYNSSYNNSNYNSYSNYDNNDVDLTEFFEDEIANSIIRAGLSCVSNLSVINQSKLKFFQIKDDFKKSREKLEKSNLENNHLEEETKSLREKNEKLTEEVLILQKELDKLKSDYSNYKARFDNIYSKNSLEIFNLNLIWSELFNEIIDENLNKAINLATDSFKPADIIVGQGFIGAKTKEDAMDWLKIIKTALIVNFEDFNLKMNKSQEHSSNENIYSERTPSSSIEYENEYLDKKYGNYSDNKYKNRNPVEDLESDEDNEDLDIPDTFANLW